MWGLRLRVRVRAVSKLRSAKRQKTQPASTSPGYCPHLDGVQVGHEDVHGHAALDGLVGGGDLLVEAGQVDIGAGVQEAGDGGVAWGGRASTVSVCEGGLGWGIRGRCSSVSSRAFLWTIDWLLGAVLWLLRPGDPPACCPSPLLAAPSRPAQRAAAARRPAPPAHPAVSQGLAAPRLTRQDVLDGAAAGQDQVVDEVDGGGAGLHVRHRHGRGEALAHDLRWQRRRSSGLASAKGMLRGAVPGCGIGARRPRLCKGWAGGRGGAARGCSAHLGVGGDGQQATLAGGVVHGGAELLACGTAHAASSARGHVAQAPAAAPQGGRDETSARCRPSGGRGQRQATAALTLELGKLV
jgi:hypothetical protein